MSFQICTRCVMDSTVPDIGFDSNGVCNYCTSAESNCLVALVDQEAKLKLLLRLIAADGKEKKYDCIVGVSGGVDSSWVLVNAVRLGLKPLAVHMDNTWNTELATNNVANLVNGLGVDLHTEVLDGGIYNRMLRAHMDADVLDLEILYDNALHAVVYRQARIHGLKFILSGFNTATEGVRMPIGWSAQNKFDARNIRNIARIFGGVRKPFPLYSNLNWVMDTAFRRIKWIPFLDSLPSYSKKEAEQDLIANFNYKPYLHKHYENSLTKIYQGLILPRKFGIDKRKPHLSSLIVTKQMTREDALSELQKDPMGSDLETSRDLSKFLRRMSMSHDEFDDYINRPMRQSSDFGNDFLITIRRTSIGSKVFGFLNRRMSQGASE